MRISERNSQPFITQSTNLNYSYGNSNSYIPINCHCPAVAGQGGYQKKSKTGEANS
ncbi:hypothetical protein SPHINGO8BC_50167 [Sphingobacterium multivorum]|uniref:Uncharacterized protein n=1 Tax=Sphingobacterium multivorum TaxID=28454 RepID=A0A654BKL0_SPHMU|nr:hypothetical protein SPHINGO8BC_50167 [Sphingobacterium multivorum]